MPPEAAVETPTQSAAPAAETISPGAQPQAGASAGAASPASSTPASPSPSDNGQKNDWFRAAFNERRYGSRPEARPSAGDQAEPERAATSESSVPSSAEGAQEPTAKPASPAPERREDTVTLSPQELDRRIQAETDRRLAKHNREEAERRRREDRKKLRETDPYGFAKLDAEQEAEAESTQKQLEQAHQFAIASLNAYDASVLDPLMAAVPQTERQKILQNVEPGIPGRGRVATEALKVLEQHWKAQGVSEARKALLNDQGFIKEVLAKFGGQRYEPEAVPAASAPGPAFSMNTYLRGEGNRVRGLSPR